MLKGQWIKVDLQASLVHSNCLSYKCSKCNKGRDETEMPFSNLAKTWKFHIFFLQIIVQTYKFCFFAEVITKLTKKIFLKPPLAFVHIFCEEVFSRKFREYKCFLCYWKSWQKQYFSQKSAKSHVIKIFS